MLISARTVASPRLSIACQEPLPGEKPGTPLAREAAALSAELTPSPRQGKRRIKQSNCNGPAGLRSHSPDHIACKLQSKVQPQQLIRAFQEPCAPKGAQDDSCIRPGPHPERATWLEVSTHKSNKTEPRTPTTVECPVCHKQVLVSSCAEHLKRCQQRANEARARPAAPPADPPSDGGLKVVRARTSWAEAPSPRLDSGPQTRLCKFCKRQVLVSSFKIHEKRCQHVTSRSASPPKSPRPSNPYRRCLWTDQAPPSLSMGPPTAFCSICERQVMASSLQQHQEKCRQITGQRQASPSRSASPAYRRTSWTDIASPRLCPNATAPPATAAATSGRCSGRQPRLYGGGSSPGRRPAATAEPRSHGGGQQHQQQLMLGGGDLSAGSGVDREVLRGPSLLVPGLSRSSSFKLLRDAEVVTAA